MDVRPDPSRRPAFDRHGLTRVRLAIRVVLASASAGLLMLAPVSAAAEPDLRLIEAVKSGDTAVIRALLKQRLDVNTPQPDGSTALHWAVYRDDGNTVDALIQAGAKVNAATDAGITPVWLACQAHASAATVLRLLTGGANPNLGPPTGETALMWCARSGNLEAVRALVARGAAVDAAEPRHGQTALMWAAATRQVETVKTLVELGANVGARSSVSEELVYNGYRYITAPPADTSGVIVSAKRGGFTPLLFTAQQGDRESATLLIDKGADVNDRDASGASALVVAAHSGHTAVAQLLLDRGAEPNAAGAGYTALHAAVLRGDLTLLKALLARGANPSARLTAGTPVRKYGVDYALSSAWIGATPYWLAAKFVERDMMRVLAEAGADTQLATEDGTTPLMAALMTAQGQGDRRDRFQTEIQMTANAAVEGPATLEAATLALQHGADVNAANLAGDTAIHVAAGRGLVPALTLLASRNAALETKNKQGLTPLAIANRRKATATVETLRSLGARE